MSQTAQTQEKLLPSSPYTIFEIRNSKTSEHTPEAMVACFKALPGIKNSIVDWFLSKDQALSFEIVCWNQRIYFLASVPNKLATYFFSQVQAQYPRATITPVGDYLPFIYPQNASFQEKMDSSAFGQMTFKNAYYFPLRTYADFVDVDPLSSILGILSKLSIDSKVVIQFLVTRANPRWQKWAIDAANKTFPTKEPDQVMPHPQKTLIEEKAKQSAVQVGINLLVVSPNKLQSEFILESVSGSFSSVSHGEANYLRLSKPFFWQKNGFLQSIFERRPSYVPRNHIFTIPELATLYHLPNIKQTDIANIAWGVKLKGEVPENLPIAFNLDPEAKRNMNFFAKTEYKNQDMIFGIKTPDRRKHMYIIGKTGVGKSTLIANMAINDMRNGKGVGIIDPHGDLCETVLDYIPKNRLNDVVYLDPRNTETPFRINPLEVSSPEQAELTVSGIVAIFHKLYGDSWGPRLEYILRNTLLTLSYVQGTTLLDVPRILTDSRFRNRITDKLPDSVLVSFWENEFNKFSDKQRVEAISPILNKVGQFLTSPRIRSLLERPKSSVRLDEIIDSKKILLLNLSQGLIGEDNAALLGAMFITKIQQAAMHRVTIPEDQREDFYLYVDEFQNFATSTFVKILSEARKYRLNLCVANQYTAQVPDDIQKAIFGNVGTLMSFLIGASDAQIVNNEFGGIYEASDLVNLDNFQAIVKLSIDNRTCQPFPCYTLPLPKMKNQNREKAIKLSMERYGKPSKEKTSTEMINIDEEPQEKRKVEVKRTVPPHHENQKPKEMPIPKKVEPIQPKASEPTGPVVITAAKPLERQSLKPIPKPMHNKPFTQVKPQQSQRNSTHPNQKNQTHHQETKHPITQGNHHENQHPLPRKDEKRNQPSQLMKPNQPSGFADWGIDPHQLMQTIPNTIDKLPHELMNTGGNEKQNHEVMKMGDKGK